tara:strand:+ start:2529 stop:3446 length:918 start_codon:yes stop_codon:yes gene_type:complete
MWRSLFFLLNSVWSLKNLPKIGSYVELSRPQNIPASMVFYAGGLLAASEGANTEYFWENHDCVASMFIISGISVYSTVINGYFDAKAGNDDSVKNPIVRGDVSFREVRDFSIKLLISLIIGIFCSVESHELQSIYIFGIIFTSIYTQFLKPIPFIKTLSVALLACLAPVCGGITYLDGITNVENSLPLVGLVGASFFGIFHREILMDVTDIELDRQSGINTIPVLWGIDKALLLSLCSVLLMTGYCVMFSNLRWCGQVGSFIMLTNVFAVYKKSLKGGSVKESCEEAIASSTLTFVMVVLSFCVW